jgi:hypothetical protein
LSTPTLTEWGNWLSENPVTFYYILQNSILEEITDQTLISQLDAMQKVLSHYGGTNITCSQANADSDVVCSVYGYPQASERGIIRAMQDDDSFFKYTSIAPCETNTEWCYYNFTSDSNKLFIAPKSSVGLVDENDLTTSCGLLYEVKPDTTNKTSSINVSVKSEGC